MNQKLIKVNPISVSSTTTASLSRTYQQTSSLPRTLLFFFSSHVALQGKNLWAGRVGALTQSTTFLWQFIFNSRQMFYNTQTALSWVEMVKKKKNCQSCIKQAFQIFLKSVTLWRQWCSWSLIKVWELTRVWQEIFFFTAPLSFPSAKSCQLKDDTLATIDDPWPSSAWA